MATQLVLFTDLDNTLFNWIDYFAPSFRAMVHALANATKLDEDEIYKQFQEVYSRQEAAEYRKAIQELRLYQSASSEVQSRLLRAGYIAFSQTSNKRLRPYPSVASTLRWLRLQGVVVIGITNSWIPDAVHRLVSRGLSKYFDALVAWDGSQLRGGQSVVTTKSAPFTIVPIPGAWRKPSTEGYKAALSCVSLGPHVRLWAIGDSLKTDLAPAHELGAATIWARYGTEYDQSNFNTILRITHWGSEQIKSTYDTTAIEPDFTVDDFAELRRIIPARQDELFPEYAYQHESVEEPLLDYPVQDESRNAACDNTSTDLIQAELWTNIP